MSRPNLESLLQKLHLELHKAKSDNKDTQATIDGLKDQVEKAIDDTEYHESLRERLDESVALFEVEHPSLTGAIQAVNHSLSSSGI